VHDAAVALCQFCGSDMPPYFHFRFHQLSVIGKLTIPEIDTVSQHRQKKAEPQA